MAGDSARALARLSGYESSLDLALRQVLETLLRLPWIAADTGGIFVADPYARRLRLAAHVNFVPFIAGTCAQVPFGRCLCGRVAERGELLFTPCVDERHETRYDGMRPHGHYVVPVLGREREVLGVIVLYVEHGHRYSEEEARALEHFAELAALLIQAARMRRDKALSDLILAHSPHGVLITDAEQRIEWVNPAFERTTGYALEEVRGRRPGEVLRSGRHGRAFYEAMWRRIAAEGCWQGEIWNRRKNGEIYPEWLSIVALRDGRGEVERYAGMFVDLSEVRAAEARVRELAYFDQVTGLPNLALLRERLQALDGGEGAAGPGVLALLVDVAHFREINGTLGRRAGDAVLRELGRRLRRAFPDAELARVGAAEFCLVWRLRAGADPAGEARARGARVQALLRRPFPAAAGGLCLEVRMGAAWGEPADPDALLDRAGLALRAARGQPSQALQLFSEALAREAALRRYVESHLRAALRRGELRLVYQPKVDGRGNLRGAEALLRWQSPEHGPIRPDFVVRVAESSSLIHELGAWVAETALEQVRRWRAAGLEALARGVALNVSPAQLLSPSMADELVAACRRKDVPPSDLELEITESGVAGGTETVLANLRALADAGFRIAIDDFGTGHSSLARLHSFPIDTLKIDRGFVRGLDQEGAGEAIVRMVIGLAHALDAQVVAEGVERPAHVERLAALGCDLFQGYHFARPLEAEAVADYARRAAAG